MARKKKKKILKKKKAGTRSSFTRSAFGVATLCSFVLIMFAGMVSAELAMVVLGLLSISLIAVYEHKRRLFWELSVSYKVKRAEEINERLARDIARNRGDIKRLKEGLSEAVQNVDRRGTIERPANPAMAGLAKKLDEISNQTRSSAVSNNNHIPFDLANLPQALRANKAKKRKNLPSLKEEQNEEAQYYASISDTVVKELLRHAISNRDINVFLQPIQRLPQRKTRFYEMFARIRMRSGIYVPASRYLVLAQQEKMLGDIDEMLLMHCLESLHESGSADTEEGYFLNISSATLKNTVFMKRLLGFIAKERQLASQLIFEVCQHDFDNMHPAVLQIIRGLGKLGCSFSLDHLEHYEFDIPLLQSLKVRFVKFNASQIIAQAKEKKGAAEIWRMKRKLEANGVGFIVERIESEFMLKELLDFEINYGQGYLLGKPDLQGTYKGVHKSIGHRTEKSGS